MENAFPQLPMYLTWWFFYCSRRWLCLPHTLTLANLPGTSSPRAMVSVAWSGLSAHRLEWHVCSSQFESLGQSALRTSTSGEEDGLLIARKAVWVVSPVGCCRPVGILCPLPGVGQLWGGRCHEVRVLNLARP